MKVLRSAVIAVMVIVAVVATHTPAVAQDPIGGPGGSVCAPGGPSGMTGVSVGYPTSPFSNSLGLTLPALNPEPISANAVIAPAAGETFAPITVVAVQAQPTAKVLRGGVLDPNHAVMRWGFTVQQFCPDTGQPETCAYTYHEMPDGSVFEVATLPDGQPFEHAFTIVCQAVHAFRAVGAPQDLGARLLAAAKAYVAPAAIEAKAAAALGPHVEQATNLPPGTLSSKEMSAWETAIATGIGLLGFGLVLAAGTCGGFFTLITGLEIAVWYQILTIPTAPPGAGIYKVGAAVGFKAIATPFFADLVAACVGLAQTNPSLTVLYDLLAFMGSAIWWTSTSLLSIHGAQFAIDYWL